MRRAPIPALALTTLLASLAIAVPSRAQFSCPAWSNAEGAFDAPVRALAVFDDGTGPALYAAGEFRHVGPDLVRHVAKWDGVSWTEVGGGVVGSVFALAVWDSGSGPALYATGDFTQAGHVTASNVARWDGRSWSVLGRGLDRVGRALAAFDDGSGPALYAGGEFITSDGRFSLSIAKWDGRRWSSLGDGLNAPVRALTTWDDGTGLALYAGGDFTASGGTGTPGVARWDGVAWAPVFLGTSGVVRALATFDDGTGSALYAGGDFTQAGTVTAPRVARFDGAVWSAVGAGLTNSVNALLAHDDGRQPALYAGGKFTSALDSTPVLRIARFDGTRWLPLAGGTNDEVSALTTFDDGAGPALAAGGQFSMAGGQQALRAAVWRDPCTVALRGTVNAGAGPGAITDVLFVNDGTGGVNRRVVRATYEPFSVFVAPPPAALGPAPFALFAWAGAPDATTVRVLPFGLGATCFPTPLGGGSPAPRAVFNNTGRASLGVPTAPSSPAPSVVVSRPAGLGRPLVFTLQGIVADRGSAASRPASVTNGVIVEIR